MFEASKSGKKANRNGKKPASSATPQQDNTAPTPEKVLVPTREVLLSSAKNRDSKSNQAPTSLQHPISSTSYRIPTLRGKISIPELDRHRKSLTNLEPTGKVLRLSKSLSLDTAKKEQVATFTNGMRTSNGGRGRMTQDYEGIVLPLIPLFDADGKGKITAPWLVRGSFYDLIIDGHTRLEAEMRDFLLYMGRSEAETRGRTLCKNRVIDVIKEFGRSDSDLKVHIYGSERTLLGLPLSDIDITVDMPSLKEPTNPYSTKFNHTKALRSLQKLFDEKLIVAQSIVREGQFPLLELQDAETGIDIDISFEEETWTSSSGSVEQAERWKKKYGADRLPQLVVLLKHALGMRQLGTGCATQRYQGGVGSFLILCMVVIFLEKQMQIQNDKELQKENERQKENTPRDEKGQALSRLFLGLLKFWGITFDFEKYGIVMEPPQIVPKSREIEPYIFEVRKDNKHSGYEHYGSGTFGIKHIKETLRFFYETLTEQVLAYNKRNLAKTPNLPESKSSLVRVKTGPRPESVGLLGEIMAGKYQWFEEQRRRIVKSAYKHERRSALPPHIRLQIGRHHQAHNAC